MRNARLAIEPIRDSAPPSPQPDWAVYTGDDYRELLLWEGLDDVPAYDLDEDDRARLAKGRPQPTGVIYGSDMALLVMEALRGPAGPPGLMGPMGRSAA